MFSIYFRRPNSGYAINKPSHEIGLSGLDFIRQETGTPGLSVDQVDPKTRQRLSDPQFDVTVDQARECGDLFAEKNSLAVNVPDQHLNRFVRQKVWVSKNSSTGEITKAGIEYVCTPSEIVDAWITDGCPLEWGFTDTE